MTATALWFGAWLRGSAASDDLLEVLALAAPDAPPVGRVLGAPPRPLPDLLGAVRASGVDSTWLLLPRPGNTIGWPRDVGGHPIPAVLLSRADVVVGLLRHGPAGWRWDEVEQQPVGTLQAGMRTARVAARELAEVVTDAAARLESLGVQRAATRAAPHQWDAALGWLPPGLDPQAEALLARLASLHDALDLALVEEGAAVTAGEVRARAAQVQEVLGRVEDLVAGVVGGLNVPTPAPVEPGARSAAAAERPV